MIINSTIFQSKAITTFFVWYFLEVPRDIIFMTGRYLKTISYIFSFIYLLKTLFSHWKGLRYAYPNKGFDINLILQALGGNLISRTVGAMVRIGAMVFGLLVSLFVIVGGIACFFVWLTFPLLFVFLIIASLNVDIL